MAKTVKLSHVTMEHFTADIETHKGARLLNRVPLLYLIADISMNVDTDELGPDTQIERALIARLGKLKMLRLKLQGEVDEPVEKRRVIDIKSEYDWREGNRG